MTMSLPPQEEPLTNRPVDFTKSVKVISLPQDVPSTSGRRLLELKNQVQRLMEAHLDPMQPTQVKRITSSCEICSDPHDTQYCMENPEQAFVEYASSRTDKAGGHKFTANAYIDVDLPMNIMYLAYYNSIRKNGYEYKGRNLVGLGRDMQYLIILSKDDYDRGCRKPSDLEDGFYRDTIKLGSEYLTRMDDEGEFTLYLMRRNLEVLRKFHWMILGGRFNQLSHVSSPLLSKPGEY
ncbi:hypothetical protein Tco_0841022 [Tanacetum coccineum]|uniref:MAK10-like protein n=1 Tax=Tanacetum coccineum TaxID=301880 RepID=A0ABQ5AV75_9ASTR